MRCVRCEVHVLRIGEVHDLAHVTLSFHGSPDMRMWCQPYAEGYGLPANFIEGVGEYLELVIAWSCFGPAAHVGLPMIAATGGEEVAGKIHHRGDEFGVAFCADPRVRLGIGTSLGAKMRGR